MPNFIRKKHPRKGEKNKNPKEVNHMEEREPLNIETSIVT
jgi:hypothetical protein